MNSRRSFFKKLFGTAVASIIPIEIAPTSPVASYSYTIERCAVYAGTRRLKAKWSAELQQDLMNMHGISID